jgi:hypothetical protein
MASNEHSLAALAADYEEQHIASVALEQPPSIRSLQQAPSNRSLQMEEKEENKDAISANAKSSESMTSGLRLCIRWSACVIDSLYNLD